MNDNWNVNSLIHNEMETNLENTMATISYNNIMSKHKRNMVDDFIWKKSELKASE